MKIICEKPEPQTVNVHLWGMPKDMKGIAPKSRHKGVWCSIYCPPFPYPLNNSMLCLDDKFCRGDQDNSSKPYQNCPHLHQAHPALHIFLHFRVNSHVEAVRRAGRQASGQEYPERNIRRGTQAEPKSTIRKGSWNPFKHIETMVELGTCSGSLFQLSDVKLPGRSESSREQLEARIRPQLEGSLCVATRDMSLVRFWVEVMLLHLSIECVFSWFFPIVSYQSWNQLMHLIRLSVEFEMIGELLNRTERSGTGHAGKSGTAT